MEPNRANLVAKEETTRENRFWVRISAACNNKCVFCLDSNAQDGKLIPEEDVRRKMREGFVPGAKNRVIISGGEASINPKFPDYIRYARELGYDRVQTVTNGNMFFRREFCEKVFSAGLQEVTFSMHGHTPELHDYLVATPGAWKRSMRGILNVKKFYPHVIVNVDVVVNKINVRFLPDIVKFYMRMGIYEYDLLQIIPFGRGFEEHKDELFYDISKNLPYLTATWKLSRIPGMYMWTNRFHAEAFEGYEDLIQDPRKIKGEVMGEAKEHYRDFIERGSKPHCWGARCETCFLHQFCHEFVDATAPVLPAGATVASLNDALEAGMVPDADFLALRGEEFPSDALRKFGAGAAEFIRRIKALKLRPGQRLANVPMCLRQEDNSGLFDNYVDQRHDGTLEEYVKKYSTDLYRKKSLRCRTCRHDATCQGIHLNFARAYGFSVLEPIA